MFLAVVPDLKVVNAVKHVLHFLPLALDLRHCLGQTQRGVTANLKQSQLSGKVISINFFKVQF